jgi:hypothetical protein
VYKYFAIFVYIGGIFQFHLPEPGDLLTDFAACDIGKERGSTFPEMK